MIDKEGQSLLELLLRVMPELRDKMTRPSGIRTDSKAAKVLYEIWMKEANKVGANKFRAPKAVQSSDIKMLETEGLVTSSGTQLTITKKGGEVLKQMILGDDRSVFEDDGQPLDYIRAVANLKPARMRKNGKLASAEGPKIAGIYNWWDRARNV